MELSELDAKLDEFAAARGWQQHHLPRSLMLARTGEHLQVLDVSTPLTGDDVIELRSVRVRQRL